MIIQVRLYMALVQLRRLNERLFEYRGFEHVLWRERQLGRLQHSGPFVEYGRDHLRAVRLGKHGSLGVSLGSHENLNAALGLGKQVSCFERHVVLAVGLGLFEQVVKALFVAITRVE